MGYTHSTNTGLPSHISLWAILIRLIGVAFTHIVMGYTHSTNRGWPVPPSPSPVTAMILRRHACGVRYRGKSVNNKRNIISMGKTPLS